MLIRYFSGQLSDAERAGFEAWIAEDPAREAEIRRLRDLWDASAKVADQPETEAALATLKERLRVDDLARPRDVQRPRPLARALQPTTYAWRIAAAIALMVGGGLLWRTVGLRAPQADQRAPMWTYATARAQRATLTLPDSSKVTLNTVTHVEIPASFGRHARDVYLDGEAYFEVAHDRKHPFRVHAGTALTEVLGTKFGVRSREGEGGVQVAVAEGRVALRNEGVGRSVETETASQLVLARGDYGRLAADGETSVARGIDVGRLLGWTEGRLAFDRTPLPQVLAELDRWFDRDFVLGDSSLGGLRLTTSLRGESLAEAIALLEAALEVKARVVGRTVILKRQ